MKILYFSWIKDGIGKNQEEINLNDNIKTISDLIDFLIKIDQNYEKRYLMTYLQLDFLRI